MSLQVGDKVQFMVDGKFNSAVIGKIIKIYPPYSGRDLGIHTDVRVEYDLRGKKYQSLFQLEYLRKYHNSLDYFEEA